MPGTPNPLREFGKSDHAVALLDERPNPTFRAKALPGFKKAVRGRRAIRDFDGRPIPEPVMEECLNHAILAPSSSNLQCYEICWVRDAAKKKELARLCLDQPAPSTAGELLVILSRVDLWKSRLTKLIDRMTDGGHKPLAGPLRTYYEDLIPMLMTTDRLGFHNLKRRLMFWVKRRKEPVPNEPVSRADHRIYGHIQASLAAQNLMLSLAAHGYESCPIGGLDKTGVARLLDLPPGAEITMVIAAGRGTPEGVLGERVRLSIDDLVKVV